MIQGELENRFLQLERVVNRMIASQGRVISATEPETPTIGLSWFDLMTNTEKTWNGSSWVTAWGGMQTHVWSFGIGWAGAVSVTGIGFRPKGLIIIAADGSATPRIMESTGYTDGVNVSTQYIFQDTAAPNYRSKVDNSWSGGNIIYLDTASGANHVAANFTSFDADGFTINVYSYTALAFATYWYMAFG